MYCENCGASLRENAKFCDQCGTQVDAGAETEVNPLTASTSLLPWMYPAERISEGKEMPPLLTAATL